MKKVLILACAALTACTNDIDLGPNKEQVETLSNAIGFQMAKKNMTTTKAPTLQSRGHYNFGVWGYKSSDDTHEIMGNYLVGYYDATKGYDTQKGSTFGDGSNSVDGKSYWMYEEMGKDEYHGKYAGEDILSKTAYQSNVSKQYLRYWDKAAEYTCFYAYAPYINGSGTARYVDGTATGGSSDTYTMTIPDGSIKEGYNDASLLEYMYATTTVKKADYGRHDVNLVFKRLNAKVNIGFWEEVPGYKVQIITLKEGTYDKGVYATPAQRSGTAPNYTYSWGQYYKSNGVKIDFGTPTASPRTTSIKQFDGTLSSLAADVNETLMFTQPSGELGTNKAGAKKSDDTYYAIPKGGSTSFESGVTASSTTAAKTGFTFHVSYKLIGEGTDEVIKVYNATVFVPETFCYWEAGKAYTYYFKITKNSNGSTDPDKTIDPTDPTPDTDKALYPIVFDGCSVDDWDTANESDHEISKDGDTHHYYMSLNSSSVSRGATIVVTANKDGGTTATVSDSSFEKYDTTSSTWVTYSGTDLTFTSGSNLITVGAGITAGKYRFNWKEGDEVVASAEFEVTVP